MPTGRGRQGRAWRIACHVDRACRTAYARGEPRGFAEISRRGRVDTEGAGHLSTYFTQSADVAHLIQVSLTPIFLISAIGVTLNVFTSRLARIVDRARAMEKAISRPDYIPEGRDLHAMLDVMARRGRVVNAAITLITLSAL